MGADSGALGSATGATGAAGVSFPYRNASSSSIALAAKLVARSAAQAVGKYVHISYTWARRPSDRVKLLKTPWQRQARAAVSVRFGTTLRGPRRVCICTYAVFFWAPMMKWGMVLAGIGDLSRPAEKLSVPQNAALAATGMIWVRYV